MMAVIDKKKKKKEIVCYQIPTSPKKRKKSGIDDIGKIILRYLNLCTVQIKSLSLSVRKLELNNS